MKYKKLTISIADKLVKNYDFMKLPEASSIDLSVNCSRCPSQWRQKARRAVPNILERALKAGRSSTLYNIIAGIYGDKESYYMLPGTSKIIFNAKGIVK